MQPRNNYLQSEIVNEGLIMVYVRSAKESKRMMMRDGLHTNVINRVLNQYNLIEKCIKKNWFSTLIETQNLKLLSEHLYFRGKQLDLIDCFSMRLRARLNK